MRIFLVCILIAMVVTGCTSGGKPWVVTQPPDTYQPIPQGFLAGTAEVDITPSPGFPVFGFSMEGTKYALGYWTRLKARVIVFQDSKGKRLAMVQIDWGAVSELLRREVAKRSADSGISPANLTMSASHTHAGPGGFFGASFYNSFGSGRSGFFPQLVNWAAERIGAGIKSACLDLAPARVAAGEVTIDGLTRNRSLEAWVWNYENNLIDVPYNSVIPRVWVVRIDHVDKEQPSQTIPIAAYIIAPLHATAAGINCNLYHGDLLGAASRYIAASIEKEYHLDRHFVAAVAVGPEGDVSANWEKQEINEAKRLGKMLADPVFQCFKGLDDKLTEIEPEYVYMEYDMKNAKVGTQSLCEPMMGVPILGGAEDGRSFLYMKPLLRYLVIEGYRNVEPKGCQGAKVPPLKALRNLFYPPGAFPDIAPIHVVRLGDALSLATLPVEATTETGFRIYNTLTREMKSPRLALLDVTNEYISYVATPEEYNAQNFEGAFTLYGPLESEFFEQELLNTAQTLGKEPPATLSTFTFYPGREISVPNLKRIGNQLLCKDQKLEIEKDDKGNISKVIFYWKDTEQIALGKELPAIKILKENGPLKNSYGVEESDQWLNMEVECRKGLYWSVGWTPPQDCIAAGSHRFVVSRPGKEPIYSPPFSLQ
ncbi:MAG: neutral/alkaline non-lysosomal ceramidase N-terminal domain-containing protein [Candidatus Aminicenantes bacterium]|nr:neutral/alkaline non-lysosomal ceramidase N-terminal domain-containing protein [Candidatus Aminicenantes bacterium]